MITIFPVLYTERFLLREIRKEDASYVFDIYSNPQVLRYQGILPILNLNQAMACIETYKRQFQRGKTIRWCICIKSSSEVLGFVTLNNFCSKKAEIGYALNVDYWHRGIMTEVLNRIIEFALYDMKIDNIEARIHPQNAASINLSKKMNFKLIGLKKASVYNLTTEVLEDRIIYSRLR